MDRRTFLQSTALFTLAARRMAFGAGEHVTLSAQGIKLELEPVKDGPALVRSLKNQATGFEWARTGMPLEPVLTAAGGAYSGWTWQSFQPQQTALGERVEFVSQGAVQSTGTDAASPVHTHLALQAFADSPAMEWRAEFQNAGASTINSVTRFGSFRLGLRDDLGALKVYSVPKLSLPQSHPVVAGETLELTGEDGGLGGLFLLEAVEHQEFLLLGIEWDTGIHFRLGHENGRRWLSLDLVGLEHPMAPGERLPAPPVFLVLAHGDREDAFLAGQHYLKQHVFPSPPENAPWVAYDIWSADAGAVEEAIENEIGFAAQLGVDMLYHDASWSKGSAKRTDSGDWGSGLGNYEDDRVKFPHGLADLSRRIHAAGMKFGLWVGPDAVDRRLVGSLISPRWLTYADARTSVNDVTWESPIVSVCLGCPEYAEYLKTNLTRVVKEFQLDWIKWDASGSSGPCTRADHGHAAGDGLYADRRAKYAILEHLHTVYPQLVIEQCGVSLDYGPARYVRANWMNDRTFPGSAVRANALASAYLYPSADNGGWIAKEDPEFPADVGNDVALDTMCRSRMIGAFGMGTLFGKLSERISLYPESVQAALRRNIALYKRYRHLLYADCYHFDGSVWQTVQFVSRAGDESVLLTFRADSPQDRQQPAFRGLAPAQTYEVTSANTGARTRVRGEALLRDGFPVSLGTPGMSEVLLLHQVE